MARKSRMSVLKRQRELRKREKAAAKRAKRHGVREEGFTEPMPTVGRRSMLDEDDDPDPDTVDDTAPERGPRAESSVSE